MTPRQAVLLGTLTVGTLDILDAFIFFGLRNGVSPAGILRGIAGGLLGRAAFQGGAATAALGLLLHFSIAFAVVLTFYLASRRFPELARNPFLYGPLYGIAVYLVMSQIVMPLSAVAPRATMFPPAPVLVNMLLIHMLGVGLPSALFARAARPPHAPVAREFATS